MRQFAFVGEAVPEVLGSCGELTAFSDLLAWLADGQWREIIKKGRGQRSYGEGRVCISPS